ncbi:MAG: acylphosphatase [Planctomycetota bacterium]
MTEPTEKARARIVISGRVQGVFFRARTRDMARKLDVTGWVRNRPDGKVEAVFEGSKEAVRKLVSWCREGPRMARVENVSVEWEDATEEFGGFSIRY